MNITINKTKKTAFITGYYDQTFKQIKKALEKKLGQLNLESQEYKRYKIIWDKLS